MKHQILNDNHVELIARPDLQGRLYVLLQQLHGGLSKLRGQGRSYFLLHGGCAVHAVAAVPRHGIHRIGRAAGEVGNGDCTEWLLWFITCFNHALISAEATLAAILFKSVFWKRHEKTVVSERQKKVLNRLLNAGKDGFEGGLSTRKYMGMTKISCTTAWRAIEGLLQKKMLRPLPGRGRNVAYEITWETK